MLDRGKANIPPGGPVRPGLHHPIPGGPSVVWWDPHCFTLEVDEPVPLRHQQILEGGSSGAAVSEASYAAWIEQREALLARASEPSLTVQTVTALSRSSGTSSAGTEPDVHVEIAARPDEKRPSGRRFGALVHAMFAAVDLDADLDAIRSVAVLQQRMFNATEDEMEAAIQAVATALRHPVLRRAAAVGEENIRRETPVMLMLEDGTIAEGVVDLAFRETEGKFSGWTVVDFKTDQEFSGQAARYMRQVQLYADAVRAATGLPARGVILVI